MNIQIDFFVLLAQIINFVILLYVFQKFIAKPFHKRILERERQQRLLQNAQDYYASRIALSEQHKGALLEQARDTNKKLKAQSQQIAKQQAKEILQKAHDDALSILEGGRRELEKERKTMLEQMKSHIIDVSLRLNEKIFGEKKGEREFLEREFEKMK